MLLHASHSPLQQMPGGTSRRLMRGQAAVAGAAASQGGHTQSAVGSSQTANNGQQHSDAAPLSERNSGKFRFWHDERRFKGGIDKCLVQQSLFSAGGVRTGGYPKTAPVCGPLGFQRPSDWDLLWSPARSALKAVPAVKAGQLVSAMPGLYSLTKKRRLSATLKAAYGDEAWQYMPQSFALPTELGEWKAWLDDQAAAAADPGPWMLKTAQHLGKGLVLLPGASAYHAATQPRLPSAKPFVLAQRYVADPLLIDGCKFGIRLWLLITGVEPFTAYLHNQGLVLFSTDSFDMEELSDQEGTAGRGHITNYAQNVNGTVWSLAMLKKHLGAEAYRSLWAKMVKNAAHVACAAMHEVRQEHVRQRIPPNTTFELLGLDYLVDANSHPWLLEVNGTPSLAVAHHDPAVEQLIHETKGAMVSDMFNMLDVRHRFRACYGLDRSGARLSAVQAQRARIALSRNTEGQAKAKVDAELHNRGGFIPLMGHFPVLRFAAGRSSSSSSQGARAAAGAGAAAIQQPVTGSDDMDTGHGEQPAAAVEAAAATAAPLAVDPVAAAAGDAIHSTSSEADAPHLEAADSSVVHFTDSDRKLFVYINQWWRQQQQASSAAKKKRRKRLKVAAAGSDQADSSLMRSPIAS